ncbi:hypothetical protein QCB44_01095 [Thiomicrorhabdus sp. zzn3]|uniref:hypothetical protein n=1 Tax=Thiomicrorhabdus sp. zzn3 TaxID=3039775 RepID=UPI00243635B8|nr:hypothetical protein [Thiomicrorhabdus sp. zzn3]MDG6777292.1 hypothetical protein [Thiomicrorhabdus sp. zzn3]
MQWCEEEYETETWSLSTQTPQNKRGEGAKLSQVGVEAGNKLLQIIPPDVLEQDMIEIMQIHGVEDYTLYDARKSAHGDSALAGNNIMFMAEVDRSTLVLLLDELNQYIQKGHDLMVFSSDVEVMTRCN